MEFLFIDGHQHVEFKDLLIFLMSSVRNLLTQYWQTATNLPLGEKLMKHARALRNTKSKDDFEMVYSVHWKGQCCFFGTSYPQLTLTTEIRRHWTAIINSKLLYKPVQYLIVSLTLHMHGKFLGGVQTKKWLPFWHEQNLGTFKSTAECRSVLETVFKSFDTQINQYFIPGMGWLQGHWICICFLLETKEHQLEPGIKYGMGAKPVTWEVEICSWVTTDQRLLLNS